MAERPVDDGFVDVVGMVGGWTFGPGATAAIGAATLLVGAPRHLAAVATGAETMRLAGDLDPIVDAIAERAEAGDRVCVLASGDPGFFGIVRLLGRRFGSDRVRVHPAPSSVSLAFARLGLSWDDATIVSAHGRPLAQAIGAIGGSKVAVFTSPDNPPERIGQVLRDRGRTDWSAAVVSRIGEADESVTRTDLAGLAGGHFDPLSVVILTAASPSTTSLAWGLPEHAFAHRGGMITKAEVRAVVLGKLALPEDGVLWDLGAGSGSVAIECARLRPALQVFAVERGEEDAARIRANAVAHGVTVDVVTGTAPAATRDLPDPDRVFVGGGGMAVLEDALGRLRPGGVAVATYALVDRAVEGWRRLGNLSQVSVARGVPLGGAGVRLDAENPVFVCWTEPSVEGVVHLPDQQL